MDTDKKANIVILFALIGAIIVVVLFIVMDFNPEPHYSCGKRVIGVEFEENISVENATAIVESYNCTVK